jgi:ankyrin repeat protein
MKRIATPILITLVVVGVAWAGCRFARNDTLNQAALVGDSNRTTELLSKGANVNGRGMHAMTPIMSAARGGHLGVVSQLVTQGADVNSHNDSGSTLMWAVDSGNEELVNYLLRSGADVRWTNALGVTALDFAREQQKTNLVRVLEAWRK